MQTLTCSFGSRHARRLATTLALAALLGNVAVAQARATEQYATATLDDEPVLLASQSVTYGAVYEDVDGSVKEHADCQSLEPTPHNDALGDGWYVWEGKKLQLEGLEVSGDATLVLGDELQMVGAPIHVEPGASLTVYQMAGRKAAITTGSSDQGAEHTQFSPVLVDAGGRFELCGGTVVSDQAYAVDSAGAFALRNGEASGVLSREGSTCELAGGVITGSPHRGVQCDGALVVSGAPVIRDNAEGDLCRGSNAPICVGALEPGAYISLSADGPLDAGTLTEGYAKNNGDTDPAKYFHLCDADKVMQLRDGEVVLLDACVWRDADGNEQLVEAGEGVYMASRLDADDPHMNGGMCLAAGDVTLKGRVEVEGDVSLVLAKGAKLHCASGMHVGEGNSLTIYGGADGGGELICDFEAKAERADGAAGIGGNMEETNGEITIYGGTVSVTGGKNGLCGAGIGSGDLAVGGHVRICGGTVNACGGVEGGAGIGGCMADGGLVEISGGTVVARGGSYAAAGIGGGRLHNGGIVRIDGGDVTAIGGSSAYSQGGAGIGGGESANGGTVEIHGGHVRVEGGVNAAGIGGGSNLRFGRGGNGGDVTIDGDACVEVTGKGGSAIGVGAGGTDVGLLHLGEDGCVRVLDGEGDSTVVSAQERVSACMTNAHVAYGPCSHEFADDYLATKAGHKRRCIHCMRTLGEAVEHSFDEGHACTVCGYGADAPQLSSTSLTLGGKISLTFWYDFHEAGQAPHAYDLELSIGGGNTRKLCTNCANGKVDDEGRRGFSFDVSAIEMGEPVTATLHLPNGEEQVETFSVRECIAQALAQESKIDKDTADLYRALANYGYYMQAYLSAENGWRIGKDYTVMDLNYPEHNDVSAAHEACAAYAFKPGKGFKASMDRIATSLTCDTDFTFNVALTPKPGCEITLFQPSDPDEGCGEVGDGEARATRTHVGVTELDCPTEFEVYGYGFEGYTMQVSPLAHVFAVLDSNESSDAAKKAMSALYWYHVHAKQCVK